MNLIVDMWTSSDVAMNTDKRHVPAFVAELPYMEYYTDIVARCIQMWCPTIHYIPVAVLTRLFFVSFSPAFTTGRISFWQSLFPPKERVCGTRRLAIIASDSRIAGSVTNQFKNLYVCVIAMLRFHELLAAEPFIVEVCRNYSG